MSDKKAGDEEAKVIDFTPEQEQQIGKAVEDALNRGVGILKLRGWQKTTAIIVAIVGLLGIGGGVVAVITPKPEPAPTPVVVPVEPKPVPVPVPVSDPKIVPLLEDIGKSFDSGFKSLNFNVLNLGMKVDSLAKAPIPTPVPVVPPDTPDAPKDGIVEVKATKGRISNITAPGMADVDWVWPPEQAADVEINGNKATVVPSADGIVWLGHVNAKKVTWYKIVSGQAPQPPPTPDDKETLKTLGTKVDKLAASFSTLVELQSAMEKRLAALEKNPPKPPEPPKPPTPAPDAAPIPVPGFRVMIIEDKEKLSLMPPAQLSIRTSKAFRDYLDANCVVESDGKTKGYRIWDHKTNATADLKLWQDALARPRSHSYTDASGKAVHVSNYLPWLIISDYPNGGFEGPLPANTEEALQLLRKIKGN